MNNLAEIIEKGRASAAPDYAVRGKECYYFETLVKASGLVPTEEALAEFEITADWYASEDRKGYWFESSLQKPEK